MRKFHTHSAGFLLLALAQVVFTAQGKAAVTTLEFNGGNGTGSVDQSPGIAGGGWAGAWTSQHEGGPNSPSINFGVVSTTPLFNGGNYLSTSINNTRGGIRRDYNSEATAPALNVANTHIVSFNHRLDAIGAGFAAGGTRVRIYDNPTAAGGTSSTNTWALAVTETGQWLAGDGNQNGTGATAVNVGLAHAIGTAYTVAVRTHPAAREYDVHISDGTNWAILTGLGYRTGTAAAGTVVHFGHDSNGTTGGFFDADDDTTFSLDALSISNGTKTWNVAGPASWFSGASWSSTGVPTIFDNVAINNGATVNVDDRLAFANNAVVSNNSTVNVAAGREWVALSNVSVDNGTVSGAGGIEVHGDIVSTGTSNLNVATVDLSNSPTGNVSVTGTLRVDSATIAASSTTGAVTKIGTGTLEIGASPSTPHTLDILGDFELAAGNLAFDVIGNASGDVLAVDGEFRFNGGALDFDVAPDFVGTHIFLTASNITGDIPVSFGDFPIALLNNGTALALTNVPEPATIALWSLLGAFGLAAACWRRKARG